MLLRQDFFHESNFFAMTNNLYYWSKSVNSRFEVAYVVNMTHFPAPRACGAREARIFFMNQFIFAVTVNFFYWSEGLSSLLRLLRYVVNMTYFAALRACGACEAGIFFMNHFFA